MKGGPIAADSGPADSSAQGRSRYRLPVLISLVGIFVVLSFHLALRMAVRPPTLWIYWFGMVLVAVPGILSGERKAAVFSLGSFAFLQCFAYTLSSPYGFVYLRDPLYNLQLATLVQTTQAWRPGMGAGQAFAYSFYPGSNLFHVAAATQRAAVGFVAPAAVSHAFTSCGSLFMFPARPVVGLIVDWWLLRSRHLPYRHLASRGVIAQSFQGLRFTAVAFTGMFLSWSALVSSPLELAWLDYASESLERLFLPHQFIAPTGSAPSGVAAGFSYTPDELAIIGMSLLILLLTTLVGVFILWRRTDRLTGPARPSAGILLVLFVVALVPMVASAPLSVTGGLFIPLRIFEFSIFGFAPF